MIKEFKKPEKTLKTVNTAFGRFLHLKESEMNIEQYLEELIKREGGYVNNPADRGGATKYGITEAVARANGYKGNMKDLPLDVAKSIYRKTIGQLHDLTK